MHHQIGADTVREEQPWQAALPECLDDDTLATFAGGRMEVAERVWVEEHLARCGYCIAVLAEAVRYLLATRGTHAR